MRTQTVPAIRSSKVRSGSDPLVMVTAYDAPGARQAHTAGVDLILVGDTLAMVVLGYDDTLQVSVDDIAHHTGAVARGLASSGSDNPRPLVVGDLPWMSYHTTVDEAVRNAATLIRAGAQTVKLEGGRKRLPMIEAIVDAEIPVMGHLGLTPQSVHAVGGFKVQARQHDAALELVRDAKALAAAGCFAIVLEAVPDEVARMVTESVDVPTIGIGAGRRLRRPGARVPRPLGHRAAHSAPLRPPLRRAGRGVRRGTEGVRRRRPRRPVPRRRRDVPPVGRGGRDPEPLRIESRGPRSRRPRPLPGDGRMRPRGSPCPSCRHRAGGRGPRGVWR